MNITTNDNSLAWTVSDKTSGSSKQKRAGKVKAASGSQDVLSNTITKYLGDSVKFENSNTARQLTLQEEQLKLEQRKMDRSSMLINKDMMNDSSMMNDRDIAMVDQHRTTSSRMIDRDIAMADQIILYRF